MMKLAWVGLVFHVAMLLWLREDGMPSFKRSEPCGNYTGKKRLMVVILPGLKSEHGSVFKSFPEGSTGQAKVYNCPAPLSYFAGVAAAPALLPDLLDTVFDHVDLTVYSGRKEFFLNKPFMNVRLPEYYRRRMGSKSERAELDGLADFVFREIPKGMASPLQKVNTTLFLVHMGGLADTNVSLDTVRRLHLDIRDVVNALDFMYGDSLTNVLLLGENGGPFSVWGPDVSKAFNPYPFEAPDVAPLISALLGIAVPFDSIGRLNPGLIACPKQKAYSMFCNALQLSALLEETTKGPTMTDLRYNSTASLSWLIMLKCFQWYDRATEGGFIFVYMLSDLYLQAKVRLSLILNGVMVALIASWIYLLWTELASVSYAPKSRCSPLFIFVHVTFALLTASAAALPLWTKWPYSFHVYLALPFMFFWAAVSRIDAVSSFFKSTSWKEVPKYVVYLIGILLLAEYTLRASSTELLALLIGLCVLVHYPALPRFVVSPFLAKCGWWVCCFCLLGALYLPQWTTRQPRLLNLCGTVLICLTGFSSFWLEPFRDAMLSVLFTLLTTAAMLIQSLARAPQYVHQLNAELNFQNELRWFEKVGEKGGQWSLNVTYHFVSSYVYLFRYLTGPMMLMPFLSLIGKNRTKNRIFHTTSSSAALLMLTSNRLEPLCFLLAVVTCWLWTLMENFRLSDKLGADEVRRAMFLGVILHTAVAVTRTLPVSYAHLDFPQWIVLIDLYRHTMILTCLMTIYLTMVPSDIHTYSSYVIFLSADAIASLRATIAGVDSTQLHLHGIAVALAFYLGRLLAATHSKPDPNDFDDHPQPNVVPPSQNNS